VPVRARQLSVVPGEPPTKLREAGHAWLAHLRAEGRSVKTLYDRERNLIVRVMGEAGLRASEVTAVGEQDLLELPGGRHQLRVIGKGNKERLVSLPPDLGRELRRFLRRRPGAGRIFLSRVRARGDYQPLDKNALTHMVERLGKTAEIPKPVHPHVLRHTFATRAAAQGVNPTMLADQLGHTP